MGQPFLFAVDTLSRLTEWPDFKNPEFEEKPMQETPVTNKIDEAIKTARETKPGDRSDKDRQVAIVITDLEKLRAYARECGL